MESWRRKEDVGGGKRMKARWRKKRQLAEEERKEEVEASSVELAVCWDGVWASSKALRERDYPG